MLEALTGTRPEVPNMTDATPPEPQPEDEHAPTNTNDPYLMSKRHAARTDLTEWLAENENDHALRVSNHFVQCTTLIKFQTGLSTSPSQPFIGTHQGASVRRGRARLYRSRTR